jgi:hypothetical protein
MKPWMQRKPLTRPAGVVMALVAASLVLAACGGDTAIAGPTTSAAAPATAPGKLVPVNAASDDELRTIPGVGPEIVSEIKEYRPYDAATGPDKFRRELGKYLDGSEVERILTHLDFGA